MESNFTEFIVNSSKSDGASPQKARTFKITDDNLEELSLGGFEGKKYKTSLVNPRSKDGRENVASEIKFISKEYPSRTDVLDRILIYDELRKKRYPVPATTRYFEKEGKHYLLMTDMTEDGNYKLWGYNDYKPEQKDEELKSKENLKSMNLSDNDINFINKIASDYAIKAQKDGFNLTFPIYHVRKNLNNGQIDMCFLDVDKRVVMSKSEIKHFVSNSEEVARFIRELIHAM